MNFQISLTDPLLAKSTQSSQLISTVSTSKDCLPLITHEPAATISQLFAVSLNLQISFLRGDPFVLAKTAYDQSSVATVVTAFDETTGDHGVAGNNDTEGETFRLNPDATLTV